MSNPHTHARTGRLTLRPIAPAPSLGFPLPRSAPPAHSGVTLARWLELWMEREIDRKSVV